MKRRIVSFALGGAASIVAMGGHHSISTVYDTSQEVTREGVIAEFHFINPHPFITMNVKTGDRDAQQWRLEMDNRSELADIGMTNQTLKQGDRIIVKGSPGRTQRNSLYIRRLDRPADGFWYEQAGSSPRIRGSR